MKLSRLFVASLFLCTAASAAVPSSINNDDSCDIKVGPAATLLLPYFEVDTSGITGQTTYFTITNVTRFPQIAHVTLWTDWAYPVLTFNIFLTGYDVQAINLYDVLVRGIVSPPSGTTTSRRRSQSPPSGGNLRAKLDCAGAPATLPAIFLAEVRNALRTGVFNPGGGISSCSTIGGVHANAIGYATIDVVASCTNLLPSDPAYYTTDLLFDNVLIGDYQQVRGSPTGSGAPAERDAAGNPMVHIRAVPEGGGAGNAAGAPPTTNLPYTFYDRYTPAANRTIDRRQPLPSSFAARFIQGGPSAFITNFNIWREGVGNGSCADAKASPAMIVTEMIRFDEHENPFTYGGFLNCTCFFPPPMLPAASSTASSDPQFPAWSSPDVGGWLYLNLNNGGSTTYSVTRNIDGVLQPTNSRTNLAPVGSATATGPRPSQGWVTATMFGNLGTSRMTSEFDAASLGNGCSPASFLNGGVTSGIAQVSPIAPAGGLFVCPPNTTLTNGTTTQCIGTNANPNP
jgi:hypothetical protein